MHKRKQSLFVTNSHMPGALGDSIAAIPTLVPYITRLVEQGFVDCVVWTCPAAKDLFPLPIPQFTKDEAESLEIENYIKIDTQEVIRKNWDSGHSLIEMYATYSFIELADPFKWPAPNALPSEFLKRKALGRYAMLAPFSHSDAGTNTKTWDSWKWHKLAETLREQGIEPVILGIRANNIAPWDGKGYTLMISQPMQEIMGAMLDSCAVITVDNGMGWLAQSLQAPHVQILSSNMPSAFAWDHGPLAKNLSTCRSVSVQKVWDAVKELQGLI